DRRGTRPATQRAFRSAPRDIRHHTPEYSPSHCRRSYGAAHIDNFLPKGVVAIAYTARSSSVHPLHESRDPCTQDRRCACFGPPRTTEGDISYSFRTGERSETTIR